MAYSQRTFKAKQIWLFAMVTMLVISLFPAFRLWDVRNDAAWPEKEDRLNNIPNQVIGDYDFGDKIS